MAMGASSELPPASHTEHIDRAFASGIGAAQCRYAAFSHRHCHPRKRGKQRERFHRKKMYCFHCHNTVNHIECKTSEEVEKFKEEFKQGVYEHEAQESMAFVRSARQR